MTFKEFRLGLKENWFQILTWAFMASMLYFAYAYGTRHQDKWIDVGAKACESVEMRVGLERRGETYHIVCIEK